GVGQAARSPPGTQPRGPGPDLLDARRSLGRGRRGGHGAAVGRDVWVRPARPGPGDAKGRAMNRCPEQHQLELLLAEQLTDAQRAALEARVEGCGACQQALQRLAGGPAGPSDQYPPAARPSPGTDLLRRLEEAVLRSPADRQQREAAPSSPSTLDLQGSAS